MKPPYLPHLGRWAAALSFSQIPDTTVRAARYQVLNMVATAHAAGRSEETHCLAGLGGFAAEGKATVLPTGKKYGPTDAALANASFSMAQDYDDIIWMGHTCHSAVFASLAVAEHEGASAEDFLTAVVVANELGGRIGATCFLGPLNGQMWTFIHLVSAAAATAKILKLDGSQTTHAMAIALAQPTFALQPGFMTPSSKLLAAGTPTAMGIAAAYFARAGMTGAANILEDRRGFFARFSYLPLTGMLEGLGEFWALETLTIKTYPGCHYFQTACTAIERILDRRGSVLLKDVTAIRIETTKLGCEATRFAGEYAAVQGRITPVNVNFDLGVTAAIMLIAGRLTSAEMEPSWLAEQTDAIHAWRDRVTVAHDPRLTARTIGSIRPVAAGRALLNNIGPTDLARLVRQYRREYRSDLVTAGEAVAWVRGIVDLLRNPAAPVEGSAVPLAFPNRVSITFRDGSVEREQVDQPVGTFGLPSMERELRAKFMRETQATLGEAGAVRAFESGNALPTQNLEGFIASAVNSEA